MDYGNNDGGIYENCLTDVCNCFMDSVSIIIQSKFRRISNTNTIKVLILRVKYMQLDSFKKYGIWSLFICLTSSIFRAALVPNTRPMQYSVLQQELTFPTGEKVLTTVVSIS